MKYTKKILFSLLCILPMVVFAEIEFNFPNQDPSRPVEPEKDMQGNIRQKSIFRPHSYSPDIIIRTNNIKAAPTIGSTGQMTPTIRKYGSVVMGNVSKVYLIWYGNWKGAGSNTSNGQAIINKLVTGLADTSNPYVKVTTQKTGTSVGSQGAYNAILSSPTIVNYSPAAYPYTTTLTDANVQSLVKDAINATSSGIPDKDAIYLVLTSSEVNESSGFCSKYCGWHTYTSMLVNGSPVPVKYGFIGNPDRCILNCAVQSTTSPNGLPGIDGMASVIAHEMEEIVTDPLLNNWHNSQGYENADMCAWTFGSSTLDSYTSSYYNVDFGAQGKFLLQRALGSNSYCYTKVN